MALRYGNRQQSMLLPPSIEEYISPEDPVRAYDAMIEAFNFHELGIDESCDKVGNAQYDPRSMLKLLVYGYSYGVRSSRKLERACHHNLSFIWLTGGLKPDHKTIANYRRKHAQSLKRILKQCVRICMKLDLIDGNILFVDGTKLKANVSKDSILDQKKIELELKKVDQRIDTLLEECEKVDSDESGTGSYVTMKEELLTQKKLRSEIHSALQEFQKQDKKHISPTDKDSRMVKNATGYFMGYNCQVVTEDKNGLIVHSEIVDDAVDYKQLDKQITKANSNLNQQCKTAVADAGYDDFETMQKLSGKGVEILVPDSQKVRNENNEFNKNCFRYDKQNDCYYCPEGYKLHLVKEDKVLNQRSYRIVKRRHCRECKHSGKCTKAIQGRTIKRSMFQETIDVIRNNFSKQKSQKIFARRKFRAEHPFAHIKTNLGYNVFFLRGNARVNAEFSLMSLAYNIKRMWNILGLQALSKVHA